MTELQHYQYISISWAGTSKSGKTNIYSVTSNQTGGELGVIKFRPGWRQYTFVPHNYTVYSRGCLKDIEDFLFRYAANPKD